MTSLHCPLPHYWAGDAWFSAGPTSSFPNITGEDGSRIRHLRPCNKEGKFMSGCKVFRVPKEDSSNATEIKLETSGPPAEAGGLKDQVLVFQYKRKFHAECPHSSYPLSNGTPFDIEDFGIVWSSGLTCPKHSWSFDLRSGRSDRGSYKLQVWEVDLRPKSAPAPDASKSEEDESEVWIRRKPRLG